MIKTINPLEKFEKRIIQYERRPIYRILDNYSETDGLLEKYKDYAEFNAIFYSERGLEYDDVYDQCCVYLLEYYLQHSSEINLKKCVNSKLKTYYRHEIRERHLNYGTNPEDIGL